MLQLFSQRGAPITCASALWLTLIGLSRSQNINIVWSGGVPHLPHLEEGLLPLAGGTKVPTDFTWLQPTHRPRRRHADAARP